MLNSIIGEEAVEANTSLGVLRILKKELSSLYPQATYNSRSMTVNKVKNNMTAIVYQVCVFFQKAYGNMKKSVRTYAK